ncbi:MAG: signal peptidase I [Candidatus Deianiraeaceae bacterium]|jgi:signal peptidase I
MKSTIIKTLKIILFGSTKNYKKKDYFLMPLYAILIAILLRSIFFDHFHVPSGSMLNTLLIGDKISISKRSYGYSRYSFPFGLAPIKGRILAKQKPKRGDIVVFKLPSNKRTNYVKRLIGLPGDTLRITHGILEINGKQIKRVKVGENSQYKTYLETLPQGARYNVIEFEDNSIADNMATVVVPAKHYFFMGDNRDRSSDSRFSVGFVHEDLLLGKVNRILASSPNSLLNIFKWGNVRTDRILKSPYDVDIQ